MDAADLAAFDRDDFDVTEWVNAFLGTFDDFSPEKDSEAQQMIGLLHSAEAELGEEIQECMTGAAVRLPGILHDVAKLEDSIQQCQEDMKNLFDLTTQGEAASSEEVNTLAKLESVHSRMDACLSSLSQTSRWSELLRVATRAIAGEGAAELSSAVDALESMAKCAEALEVLPGAAERSATLSSLQKQLETVLAPRLTQCLSQGKAGRVQLKAYVDIYAKIGRLDMLKAAYAKALPGGLHKKWYSFVPGTDSVEAWLPKFEAEVASLWTEERSHVAKLFGEDSVDELLLAFLRCMYEPLQTDYGRRVATAMDDKDTPLLASLHGAAAASLCGLLGLEDGSTIGPNAVAAVGVLQSCFAEPLAAYRSAEEARLKARAAAILGERRIGSGTLLARRRPDGSDIFGDAGAEKALSENLSAAAQGLLGAITGDAVDAMRRAAALGGGLSLADVRGAVDLSLASLVEALGGDIDAAERAEGQDSIPWDVISGALQCLKAVGCLQAELSGLEDQLLQECQRCRREFLGISGQSPAPQKLLLLSMREALRQDPVKQARLEAFFTDVGAAQVADFSILSTTKAAARNCAVAACGIVFRSCFQACKKNMQVVSTLDSWASEEDAAGEDVSAYATEISNQLFTVMQCLENWCGAEDAVEALEAMDVANSGDVGHWSCESVLDPWRELGLALSAADHEEAELKALAAGADVSAFCMVDEDGQSRPQEKDGAEDTVPSDRDGGWICNTWLGSLGAGVVAIFVAQVLMVPRITRCGTRQLKTDTSYLLNVFQGLGIDTHPLLPHLHFLATLDDGTLQARLNTRRPSGPASKLLGRVESAFGRARGLASSMEA